MRVEFKKDGGIAYLPGLNRPTTIDTADLDPGATRQLTELVEAACFFELPDTLGSAARGAADYQSYSITIENGNQKHSVRVSDLSDNQEVAALVSFLNTKTKELRKAAKSPPEPGS